MLLQILSHPLFPHGNKLIQTTIIPFYSTFSPERRTAIYLIDKYAQIARDLGILFGIIFPDTDRIVVGKEYKYEILTQDKWTCIHLSGYFHPDDVLYPMKCGLTQRLGFMPRCYQYEFKCREIRCKITFHEDRNRPKINPDLEVSFDPFPVYLNMVKDIAAHFEETFRDKILYTITPTLFVVSKKYKIELVAQGFRLQEVDDHIKATLFSSYPNNKRNLRVILR